MARRPLAGGFGLRCSGPCPTSRRAGGGGVPLLEEELRVFRSGLGGDHLWILFAAVDVELARHVLDPSVPLERLEEAYGMARGWSASGDGMRPTGVDLVEPLVTNLEALEMDAWAARFRALLPEATTPSG